MSHLYQKQRVIRIEYKRTTFCDICKQPITNHDPYQENEVAIEAKIGKVFPESDHRACIELDCCTDCFTNKVQPILERELGARFRLRDADDFGPRGGESTVENLDPPSEGK